MNQEKTLTPRENDPVFLHSLFRTGSTYFFNVFRRSARGYWCYQEPLNDLVLWSQGNKEKLLEFHENTSNTLRHPHLDRPYFWELHEVADQCLPKLKKKHIYDAYFPEGQEDVGQVFFESLIRAAKAIPMIQECRTSMRIQALKNKLGGRHLYLWRNPWDQWWSYKVSYYFDLTNQLFINGKNYPEVISRLRREIGFHEFHNDDLQAQFDWFARHRLSPDKNYMLFYTLWLLGLQHGMMHADALISIDRLSREPGYGQRMKAMLEERGLIGLDLTDCQIPQACYGREDKAFFREIEEKVHDLFLCSGGFREELDDLLHLRHSCEPETWTDSGAYVNGLDLIRDAERARTVVQRIEEREVAVQVAASKYIESTVAAAEARVQQAEARVQQAEARVQQAEARGHRAEAKVQETEVHIAALLNSTSWRITRPLRGIRRVLRGDLWPIVAIKNSLKRRLKNVIVVMIAFVRRRPFISRLAFRCLNYMPRLKMKLRALEVRKSAAPASFPAMVTLDGLSPRASRIYHDLKLAIERYRKRSS